MSDARSGDKSECIMQFGQVSAIRNKLEERKLTEKEFSVQLPGTHPAPDTSETT